MGDLKRHQAAYQAEFWQHESWSLSLAFFVLPDKQTVSTMHDEYRQREWVSMLLRPVGLPAYAFHDHSDHAVHQFSSQTILLYRSGKPRAQSYEQKSAR